MTILEKFLNFAERLSADRLTNIETVLTEIMESYSQLYDFSDNELTIIDKRIADNEPQYASDNDIHKLFGKPFTT